jgi:RES domain-containing protein
VPVIYGSATLSLAALEYLVHVNIDEAPDDLVAIEIEAPDAQGLSSVKVDELPRDWGRATEHPECLRIGDSWAGDGETLALQVPSAIIPEESNVLLNPRHSAAGDLRIVTSRPFSFDPRLRAR